MSQGSLGPQLSWWMLLLLAVGLLLTGELGHWIGRLHHGQMLDEQKTQTGLHVGALLGLLGLLLAFSFNIVESRFEARKALVLEEANAIGTTYLRAKMLPAPSAEKIRGLLRDYVDARARTKTPDELERTIQSSAQIHSQLWSEATVVATANPTSTIVPIFVNALNNMIDLHEARVTVGIHQRLPLTVLVMLYVIAGVSIVVMGYGAGLSRTRALLPTTALVLAITSVITLVVDLDAPVSRLFRVNQSAIYDLRNTIAADEHDGAGLP